MRVDRIIVDGQEYFCCEADETRWTIEPLKFNAPEINGYDEYKYSPLPRNKTIRLLMLLPGGMPNLPICCELLEKGLDDEKIHNTITTPNGGGSYHGDGLVNQDVTTNQDAETVRDNMDHRTPFKVESETPENQGGERKRERGDLETVRRKAITHAGKYEALSWTRGDGGTTYKMKIRQELASALRFLRLPVDVRVMWIDAVCINQDDLGERNHQVQMMSRIYSRAQQVCVWLGEADRDSRTAIEFIHDDIIATKKFDILSTLTQRSSRWQALLKFMQRDWFSRRWIIQEIALAHEVTMYCGADSIPWKSFAMAVELIIEIETATRRLSEVIGLDERYRLLPGFFEHATRKVFKTKHPVEEEVKMQHSNQVDKPRYDRKRAGREMNEPILKRRSEKQSINPVEGRNPLSLEYLVTTLLLFQTSEPRDVVYSLLAIARDAYPLARSQYGHDDRELYPTMPLLGEFPIEKPFEVDYSRPYSDISRDCWGPTGMSQIGSSAVSTWSPTQSGREMATTRSPSIAMSAFPRRVNCRWRALSPTRATETMRKTRKRRISGRFSAARTRTIRRQERRLAAPSRGWERIQKRYFPTGQDGSSDINLPTWVARASQAPFILNNSPGMQMKKTSRANADPLVGPPHDGYRNYHAAGPEMLALECLKFRKRPVLGHYSLYVKGFELDEVKTVDAASQLGNIPMTWLNLAGWTDWTSKDPPDEFWKTIVANRGPRNRKPPYYYARACRESVSRGNHSGGSINTAGLIQLEQNSIVAEFWRRVQAVIWNRSLFKTKSGRLGLASNVREGDRVCILYGLTVPVILRQHHKRIDPKTPEDKTDLELEEEEDRIELLKTVIARAIANRQRKSKYHHVPKKKSDDEKNDKDDAREKRLDEEEKEKEKWQEILGAGSQCIEEKRTIIDNNKKVAEGPAAAKDKTRNQGSARESRKGKGRSKKGHQGTEGKTGADDWRQEFVYEFIGECYLHGMMEGEAMREKLYNDKFDTVFELR
ncbi:HET-domain-containing protein [Podospora aff. communis PSN243]|uniref:HET-domain-containing protein n=1 Tax=Podospora aff. communis PSN243 TaxID=3040156 RepID=A0AAV9GXF0_9PEZI|nr:HET-domain-containing protein [Podospora aff. communis PSN243]